MKNRLTPCLCLALLLMGCSPKLPASIEEYAQELLPSDPSVEEPTDDLSDPDSVPDLSENNTDSSVKNNFQLPDLFPITPEENEEMATLADSLYTSSMSDYEKVKSFHDYLVIHVDYDYDNLASDTLPDSAFTAEGALLLHSAVCEGYAKAFSYLCQKAGLEEQLIYGTADDGTGVQTHAWNQVKVDDEWYNIDVTWDDPLMNGKVITDGSNITYEYFLVPDDPFYTTHTPESPAPLQTCTSDRYLTDNRRLTIEPYLTDPYTFLTTQEDIPPTITQYLTANTLQFQLVCDTPDTTPESLSDYALTQTKEIMLSLSLYGQISVETQYGIADYTILSITITP